MTARANRLGIPLASIIMFALGASACGGDSNDAADAGPGVDAGPDAPIRSTALDPVCAEADGLFVALFEKAFDCNPFFTVVLGELNVPAVSAFCYSSFQPFIDDGTLRVSETPADIAACRTYIDDTQCQLLDLDVTRCDPVLIGTVAPGSDCDISEQCTAGNYCDNAGPGCGTCATALANGTSCADDDECSSSYCTVAGACADKGRVDDPCGADDDCLGQLACDEGGTDLCVALAPVLVGDACDDQDFAACGFPISGLFCSPATDLCVAEVDIGVSCDSVDSRCHTLFLEWCDAGTCAAPVAAGVGQACGIGFNTPANKCTGSLVCTDLFDGGTCVAPQVEGQSCVDSEGVDLDAECAFLLTCVEGICAASEHSGMCPAP